MEFQLIILTLFVQEPTAEDFVEDSRKEKLLKKERAKRKKDERDKYKQQQKASNEVKTKK